MLLRVLGTVAWGDEHFGGVMTGGPLKRRDVMRAVKRGFVVSKDFAEQCDDDGFLLEGRCEREAFTLTDAGKAYLAAHDSYYANRFKPTTEAPNV